MIIRNAFVYTEESRFEQKDIYICGTEFADIPRRDVEVLDAEGCYAIPGLTDIHFHGCMGADICDDSEEALQEMAVYEAQHGITTILPATMTLPEGIVTELVMLRTACWAGYGIYTDWSL